MKNFAGRIKGFLFKKYHTPLEKIKFQFRLSTSIPLIFALFVFAVSLFYINLFSQILFTSTPPQGVDLFRLVNYLRIFFLFTFVASLAIGLVLAYAIIVPGRKLAKLIGISIKGQELKFEGDYSRLLPEVEKLLSELGERIWEGSRNMAFVVDSEKRILNFNHQARKFFGLESDYKKRELYNIIPPLPDNTRFFQLLNKGLKRKEGISSRIKIIDVHGEELDVLFSLLPLKKEEDKFLMLLNFLETELLEEKIYKEELEEKILMLNRILTTFTHEVKNPLSVIKGVFSLLQEEGKLEPKIIEILLGEVNKMEQLLEDFLLLQKPLAKKLKPSWIDISDFIKRSVEGIKYIIRDRQDIDIQGFYLDYPVFVNGDPKLLNRAIYHIIKNGIEAIPEGGRISVSLQFENGNVIIEIEDNGKGIPPQEINKIFDPFYTTKEEGTGLGLSLAKQIINAHGGEISIESEVNKGTKVKITISGIRGEEKKNYEQAPGYLSR